VSVHKGEDFSCPFSTYVPIYLSTYIHTGGTFHRVTNNSDWPQYSAENLLNYMKLVKAVDTDRSAYPDRDQELFDRGVDTGGGAGDADGQMLDADDSMFDD
jgi:hypothetical protein